MIKKETKEYFTSGNVINKKLFATDDGYVKSTEVVQSWPSWKKEIVGSVTRKKAEA